MKEETLTYNSALEELESITAILEGDETDIDQLSKIVKRAKYLVEFCQEKLRKTESELKGE